MRAGRRTQDSAVRRKVTAVDEMHGHAAVVPLQAPRLPGLDEMPEEPERLDGPGFALFVAHDGGEEVEHIGSATTDPAASKRVDGDWLACLRAKPWKVQNRDRCLKGNSQR